MKQENNSRWQFWIDCGGTFTDVVARAPDGGIATKKLLSQNPERYRDAAVQGIREVLRLAPSAPIPAERIEAVKMGTTVATNALLERKGEPVVLVTTSGLGQQLRLAYQNRPRLFDRHIVLPEMLYSRVIEAEARVRVRERFRGARRGTSRLQRSSTTCTSSARRRTAHGRSRRQTVSSSSMRCSTTQ